MKRPCSHFNGIFFFPDEENTTRTIRSVNSFILIEGHRPNYPFIDPTGNSRKRPCECGGLGVAHPADCEWVGLRGVVLIISGCWFQFTSLKNNLP